jgi:hypothetical protein
MEAAVPGKPCLRFETRSATIVSRTALSRVFVARKREELAVALGHIKYRKKMDFATSKTTKASMCSATFTAATAAAF